MKNLKQILSNLLNDESGQDLIEYAFVICLIALAAVAAMNNLAGSVRTTLGAMGTKLTAAT